MKITFALKLQAKKLKRRKDGSDFDLGALSWLLKKYWNHPALTYSFKEAIIEAIIQLPFW